MHGWTDGLFTQGHTDLNIDFLPAITPLLFGPDVFLNTLFSKTFSLL